MQMSIFLNVSFGNTFQLFFFTFDFKFFTSIQIQELNEYLNNMLNSVLNKAQLKFLPCPKTVTIVTNVVNTFCFDALHF